MGARCQMTVRGKSTRHLHRLQVEGALPLPHMWCTSTQTGRDRACMLQESSDHALARPWGGGRGQYHFTGRGCCGQESWQAMGRKNGQHCGIWHFDVINRWILNGQWRRRSCSGESSRDGCTISCSNLDLRRIVVFNAELWAIRIALQISTTRAYALRTHRVTIVEVLSTSQAAMRHTAHLDPRPGRQLARALNEHARALCAQSNKATIDWVPQPPGISGNEPAGLQPNRVREDRDYTVHQCIHTLAANRAGVMSTCRVAVKPKLEAYMGYKHYR